MNRIKALSLLAISVLALQLHAQQDVQFTQYMHNRIFFNPGMAGNSDAILVIIHNLIKSLLF